MYVGTRKLRAYAAKNGQNWAYTGAYLPHQRPAPLARRGRSTSISIAFTDPLYPRQDADYAVRYQYDRATNTYLRYMGGVPHVDADTGQMIRPANVIIIRTGPAVADPNAGPTPESILIPLDVGKGRAVYFRDGHIQYGTWSQTNRDAPLRFLDARGRLVGFNPGQTWVEVVPAGSPVSWSVR
jgi:hypothetical protein